MAPVPCGRCGSFLAGDALRDGLPVCEDCVELLVEGEKREHSAVTALGLVGGGAAFILVAAVAALNRDAELAVYAPSAIAGGMFGGGMFGLVIDRARRRSGPKSFSGPSWIAIIEQKTPGGRTTTSGLAFAGTACFLFAAKDGRREIIRAGDIDTVKKVEAKRVEVDVTLSNGPARLYLVGEDARAVAERMFEG
jgi:hypothetical protein